MCCHTWFHGVQKALRGKFGRLELKCRAKLPSHRCLFMRLLPDHPDKLVCVLHAIAVQGVSETDTSSSWLSSGCHTIRRKTPLHRHHPYTQARPISRNPAIQQQQQQASAVTSSPDDSLGWQSLGQCQPRKPQPQQQQPQVPDVTGLQHQPLEKLLDIAISLASRSLARTMSAFQAACQCWAHDADSDLASRALEYAENCMARTIHRMQIAQQLASAVIRREQQSQQQVQRLEQHKVFKMMQLLQHHQQLQVVHESDEEGEEEVCSTFRPAVSASLK